MVESCCETVEEAVRSAEAGAGRIEFCSALWCGGLTPLLRDLRAVTRAVEVPVFALIRPREGDFVFSEAEVTEMRRSIDDARGAGAGGVVIGALSADYTVDTDATTRLMDSAAGLEVTFHKAFDECPDLDAAFEACRLAGVTRILTSGGAKTALDGVQTLQRLASLAGPSILPGGRVRAGHIHRLVKETGVSEVHARAEAVPGILAALKEN
ncbi:MAG: copper homeostasis protein CutC [Thalassolituus oleivorans]